MYHQKTGKNQTVSNIIMIFTFDCELECISILKRSSIYRGDSANQQTACNLIKTHSCRLGTLNLSERISPRSFCTGRLGTILFIDEREHEKECCSQFFFYALIFGYVLKFNILLSNQIRSSLTETTKERGKKLREMGTAEKLTSALTCSKDGSKGVNAILEVVRRTDKNVTRQQHARENKLMGMDERDQ